MRNRLFSSLPTGETAFEGLKNRSAGGMGQDAICTIRVHPWLRLAVLLAAALAPAGATAAVEWHADLDTARAAARISRRPVLAVFVASWGDGADSRGIPCLDSPEAEAVLATCYEPVLVDIDEQASLTRALGIIHVPSACVLADDDKALSRFDLSGSPAAFVKAAILAAQRAATSERGTAADGVDHGAARREEPPTATAAGVFGSAVDPAPAANRPPRGSMASVTAKVRDLSAFATGESRPAAVASPVPLAQAARPTMEPQPDYSPVAWPTERAAAPPTAPVPPSPTIEPAATALAPASVTPWLARPAPATQSAAVPTPQAVTPQAAAPQAAAPLPPTSPPTPQPATGPSGWLAALQKPFGLPWKPANEPPPVTPAVPRSPFAAATPPAAPATAAQAPAAETDADPQGSMPLGLEGYCPVTLVDRGAWTEGRAQWGARHRGRTYLFAGPAEQQAFLADPDRYAPALSGDDAVLALDRGSSTPGQRRYGVTFRSRIYLFATPETQAAFAAEPDRYAARIALAERPAASSAGTRLY